MFRGRGNFVVTAAVPDFATGNRRAAPPRGVKRRQIQPLHQVANVVRKVALRLPIPHIRRQQQALLRVVGAKSRRHPSLLSNPVPVLSHPCSYGAHS